MIADYPSAEVIRQRMDHDSFERTAEREYYLQFGRFVKHFIARRTRSSTAILRSLRRLEMTVGTQRVGQLMQEFWFRHWKFVGPYRKAYREMCGR